MNRRKFLKRAGAAGIAPLVAGFPGNGRDWGICPRRGQGAGQDLRKDWLARWEKRILNDARNRYCDREMGEEIGWLVSPFLKRLLLRLSGHARPQVGGSAGRLGRRLDHARREGAGRLHRLAEGRRRQHQRHAGPVHRQHARRGDGPAARGLDGRRRS